MSIEATSINESLTLEVTLSQSNFALMELISEYCEFINKVVIADNKGMTLSELKQITDEITNIELEENRIQQKELIKASSTGQRLGYQQIKGQRLSFRHIMSSNTRQYTMVFGKAYKAEIDKMRKKYDIQINLYAGNIEIRSGLATLSAFLQSQFSLLQDKFKYFECFSPEIIRKIKYSKAIEDKMLKKKIHYEVFHQKLKEGYFIYNTSNISVYEMITFIENICVGHMEIIFLANRQQNHTNGHELLLTTHALKHEMEILNKTYDATVEVNKRKGVALIHSKHWIFSREIKQSVRSAFNCVMSFSIPDMNLSPEKKVILRNGLKDVNYSESIKARYTDFRLSVIIHALNYNLEELIHYLKSVQQIIEPGNEVSFHVSHLSSLKMRVKLQNIVLDIGRRQKMEARCEQTKNHISSASLIFKDIDRKQLISEITHQTLMEIQSFKVRTDSPIDTKQKLTQQKKAAKNLADDDLEFE